MALRMACTQGSRSKCGIRLVHGIAHSLAHGFQKKRGIRLVHGPAHLAKLRAHSSWADGFTCYLRPLHAA